MVMVLAACDGGGGGGPIDAPTDATIDAGFDTYTCDQLASELRTRAAATSRQCSTAGDCVLDGYPMSFGGTPTCNCGATWSVSCGGDPINAAAWTADPIARALNAEWMGRCIGGTNGLCDCTRGTASCVDGTCRGTTYDCFSPPDAGVR